MLWKIRRLLLKTLLRFFYKNINIASFSYIGVGTHFDRTRKIFIGKSFSCGLGCHLAAEIVGGDDIMLASRVSFVGGDHQFDRINVPMNVSGRAPQRGIKLGSNIWIGHGAIILDGVTIEDGVVVGAGSVVTKSLKSNGIYAGSPAKLIRYRYGLDT
jgi:acetyltransferase-like isoleucine patch superfamily enzyme